MVGSAIFRYLIKDKSNNIITKNKSELDLTIQSDVDKFFKYSKIDQVYLAAAKVGGIYANESYPYDFLYENLMIQNNLINAAFKNDIRKLLFLGSSCIYPKYANQPISEYELLSGKLEPTNESYAIAKIAGIKLCNSLNYQYKNLDYRSVMPTNLYGPGDNYHLLNSHVIPAMIRKFHEAKINSDDKVTLWGSGSPLREFLHVDDLAEACVYIMNLNKDIYYSNTNINDSHVNIGSGKEISILQLAQLIKEITKFDGNIVFDSSKPDGTPKKLLNSKKINDFGWRPKISLKNGLIKTYQDFEYNYLNYSKF